jgi:hypothetical protein
MNFNKSPLEQIQPKKEYKFSSENMLDEHVLDDVFNIPSFKEMADFFTEGREGKISCSLALNEGGGDILIETKEPIQALSFEEMKYKIQEWIAFEVEILSEASMNTSWDIKSFAINFDFGKDGKEMQTGYRNIINKNF